MACLIGIARAEEIDGGMNIDDRDDRFLKSEDNKLNAFIDIVNCEPPAWIGLIAPKCLDRCRYLENAEVDNDHCEHGTQYALISDDQV